MYKFLLIIVLVILIVMIAKGVVKLYQDKLAFYKNIKSFFDVYKLNIGFKKDKIKDIVKNYSCDGEAKVLLDAYYLYLDGENDINYETKVISEEEKTTILNFLKNLGQGDFTTEKEQLKISMDYLSTQIEKSKSENEKVCPLIIKLTLLFALLVAILFI